MLVVLRGVVVATGENIGSALGSNASSRRRPERAVGMRRPEEGNTLSESGSEHDQERQIAALDEEQV